VRAYFILMTNYPLLILLSISLFVVTPHASALSDDPLIARYPNTELSRSIQKEFIKYPIARSPISENGELTPLVNGGSLSHRLYIGSETDSIHLAFDSFSAALNNNGFTTVFECSNESCGGDLVYALFGSSALAANYANVQQSGPVYNDFYYLATEKIDGDDIVNVVFYFYQYEGNRLTIVQDIFQPQEIALKDIAIDFNALSSAGRIVLDGIFFDTAQTAVNYWKIRPSL